MVGLIGLHEMYGQVQHHLSRDYIVLPIKLLAVREVEQSTEIYTCMHVIVWAVYSLHCKLCDLS